MRGKYQQQEIDHARNVLRSNGYYVENLWNIDDVLSKIDLPEDEAYQILDDAMQNEAVYQQIWMSIEYSIDSFNENKTK